MRINEKVTMRISDGTVISRDSFDYVGPLESCGSGPGPHSGKAYTLKCVFSGNGVAVFNGESEGGKVKLQVVDPEGSKYFKPNKTYIIDFEQVPD